MYRLAKPNDSILGTVASSPSPSGGVSGVASQSTGSNFRTQGSAFQNGGLSMPSQQAVTTDMTNTPGLKQGILNTQQTGFLNGNMGNIAQPINVISGG